MYLFGTNISLWSLNTLFSSTMEIWWIDWINWLNYDADKDDGNRLTNAADDNDPLAES